MNKVLNIVIPMAGLGSRFANEGFKNIKPLIKVNNKTFIEWSVDSVDFNAIKTQFIFIILENHRVLLEKHLNEIKPDCIILSVPELTRGATETCLKAIDYINNDDPLIITNSDQIFEWNKDKYLEYLNNTNTDADVVVVDASTNKFSYIEVNDNGYGIRLTEKEVISNNGLVGIHYWKHGKYFIESANELIFKNIRSKNEYYISLTYNLLIEKGINVTSYKLASNEKYLSVGTPEQLNEYLNYKNLNVKKHRIENFTRGWFIGDFEPSVEKNKNVEVGYMTYSKNERVDYHYHEHCREINLLIKGTINNAGVIINEGDIFIFEPFSVAIPIFLEDSIIVVFKDKCSNNDKVIL